MLQGNLKSEVIKSELRERGYSSHAAGTESSESAQSHDENKNEAVNEGPYAHLGQGKQSLDRRQANRLSVAGDSIELPSGAEPQPSSEYTDASDDKLNRSCSHDAGQRAATADHLSLPLPVRLCIRPQVCTAPQLKASFGSDHRRVRSRSRGAWYPGERV
jgi:hypothetical protein